MVAGFFLAFLALFSPVGGIAVLLFTDKSCQNQVGRLEGNYGGVCQSTLGTAAISFKVVNIDSGCLVTLYPAAKPPCPVTNFGFSEINRCYENSNGSIAAYSVDLCDPPAASPSPSVASQPTTPTPQTSPPPQTHDTSRILSTPATSAPITLATSSPPKQGTLSTSPNLNSPSSTPSSTPLQLPPSSLPPSSTQPETPPINTTNSEPTTPPAANPPPTTEGLSRQDQIIIGVVIPIIGLPLTCLATWFAWRQFQHTKQQQQATAQQ